MSSSACRAAFDPVATTRPYYRSTYVFVSRRDRRSTCTRSTIRACRRLRIGVQMIGDDFANTPPAHALASRGMTSNVVGYPVYGDYAQPSPLSTIVDGRGSRRRRRRDRVGARRRILRARQPRSRSCSSAVSPQRDSPSLPFVFDISMGVRRGDAALRAELDDFLARRRADDRRDPGRVRRPARGRAI